MKQVSSNSVSKKENNSKRESKCNHCGKKNYPSEKCKFKSATCHKSKKQGRIAPVPTTSKGSGDPAVEKQESSPPHVSEDKYSDFSSMYKISSGSESPTMVNVRIETILICMELDTGSGKSVVSEKFLQKHFPNLQLQPSSMTFVTYTKEEVKPLGYLDVKVEYDSQLFTLPLYVIKTDAPPGTVCARMVEQN